MNSDDRRALVHRAAQAHTNLNTLAAVQAILESGCLYQVGRIDKAAVQIIRICEAEKLRQLRIYDEAIEREANQ